VPEKGRSAYARWSTRAALLCLVSLAACGGTRDAFVDGRVLDRCESAWPACDTLAPCLLGPESYAQGRFPGASSFLVQLVEASTVRLSFFLEDVVAAGERTVVTFHEEGCRSRVRTEVTGRSALNQMDALGSFTQSADLTGVGDHLVQFESDLQGRYVLKVDVTPGRQQAD